MLRKRGLVVVVLALILALAAMVYAEGGEGCYFYPEGSEDWYCVPGVSDIDARADCENYADCNFDNYFRYGSECSPSELPECERVKCNVDCTVKAWGKCLQEGGEDAKIVLPGEEAAKCNPGCCQINSLGICDFGRTAYECKIRARSGGTDNFLFDSMINRTKCDQDVCRRTAVTGNLTINVKNEGGSPVPATISLERSGLSPQTRASATFSDIQAQTYSVRVTADSYSSETVSVSLLPGENKIYNVTLRSGQGLRIEGTVRSGSAPLGGATITYSGPLRGTVVTDASGNYIIPSLVEGSYTVTASKIGFEASPPETVNLQSASESQDFDLAAAETNKIVGVVRVDDNNDGQCGLGDERYGARLYLDGDFRALSRFTPIGHFEIPVPQIGQSYEISATYDIYGVERLIRVDHSNTDEALCLTKHQEICGPDTLLSPVADFTANHILGVKAVKLGWVKPCPEVTSYEIWKDGTKFASASPAESSFIDKDVAWGTTYTYKIKAVYGAVEADDFSPEKTITLGNYLCEGKIHNDLPDTFCRKDGVNDRKVWKCNEQNQLTFTKDCAESGTYNTFFCAPLGKYRADCKSEGQCALFGGPLGIYYTSNLCYGISDSGDSEDSENPENLERPNSCVFDTTSSITDFCQGCSKIRTCFDYVGKDACTINNCLTDNCTWINGAANTLSVDYGALGWSGLITPETGRGYCVPGDYKQDDRCGLCGPKVTLFENYFCTADVCRGLGRCFSGFSDGSSDPLSICHACQSKPRIGEGSRGENDYESNCYAYESKAECTGDPDSSGTESDSERNIIPSQDSCQWQRCSWKGATNFDPNGCRKDGDANGEDDCAVIPVSVDGCKTDITPPVTSIYPQNITPIISHGAMHINITFGGVDERNIMSKLNYCLVSADPYNSQTCGRSGMSGVVEYDEVSYPGYTRDERVAVDILNSKFLQNVIPGETYRLKYFSLDIFSNQENPQQTFVYVDNVLPAFKIMADILTIDDKTDLRAYLVDTAEPMSCSFALSQILPKGQTKVIEVGREEKNKGAEFKNLLGVRFDLNVTCIDDHGNVNNKIENYIFNVSGKVKVISPIGPTTATKIPFIIKTAVGATCALYLSETNEKVVDFTSDEIGKDHYTKPLPGFVEGKYPATYKAVCQELLNPEDSFEGYFNFEVDLTPPKVQIVLKEGSRTRKPRAYGWEELFINSTQVSFECTSEGFNCTNTYYCLGDGCEMIAHAPYQTYSAPFTVTTSGQICYYATDSGNNTVYSPICGNIKIDGFGITLEKPILHFYHHKQWGVSNKLQFDWQFYTKIPTEECRFDLRPNFDYYNLQAFKKLKPNLQGKYLIPNFPQGVTTAYPSGGAVKTIYVRCQDSGGMLSPEQEINLEYDPIAPVIKKAYAQPNEVFEGISTQLFVITDDKTLCKYDKESGEFETMLYKFPGFDGKELDENHESTFDVGATGENGVTNYNLKTQCSNGAGDLSDVRTISFMVDYNNLGYIIPSSLKPKGYVTSRNTTLEANTNKQARCTYRAEGPNVHFTTTGGLEHREPLNDLAEQDYRYALACRMQESGHLDEDDVIIFTVDYSAPIINGTDDGKFTCGKDISLSVYTNEKNISTYEYELYNAGMAVNLSVVSISANSTKKATTNYAKNITATNTGSRSNNAIINSTNNTANNFVNVAPQILPASGNLVLVANRTVVAAQPLVIPAGNLTLGNRYVVKIKAKDMVGLISTPATSDGVIVVGANYSVCTEDKTPPKIYEVRNDSCSGGTTIELYCEDATGCKNFKYGTSLSKSCNVTQNYNGQKIALTRTNWLCYSVEDNVGNKENSTTQLTIADKDGDGISNTCDQCKDTKPGKVVDVKGCANGEVPAGEQNDTDGDGLVDYWEKSYDDLGCAFNYTSRDSDGDGVYDALADYDGDGFTNYEEYISSTDPCGREDVPDYDPFGFEDSGPENVTIDFSDEEPDQEVESPSNILAWTFLIIGLLLVLGGTGYLIYFYQQKSPPQNNNVSRMMAMPIKRPTTGPNTISSLKGKFEDWRKDHLNKQQSKQRSAIFGAFTSESTQIPHVTEALKMKAPHLDRLQELAQHYADHKDTIQPGLKPEEKGVFSKLDTIAKQMKNKDIEEVITKDEAKDIFSQLRNLSNKRKKQ